VIDKGGEIHLVTMNSAQSTICPDWQVGMLEMPVTLEADSCASAGQSIAHKRTRYF